MKNILLAAIIIGLLFASCNADKPKAENPEQLVLHFTMDKDGNVVEEEAKAQILALGKHIHETADKQMMHVYTEQTGTAEGNIQLGQHMARAVKQLTKTQGERSAYNLGVQIHGYENPVDSLNPASIKNRRIEVRPL